MKTNERKDKQMKFRDLRAEEIECRVSQINGNGLALLLYKDARCDMNILDETVGSMNWQRTHTRENANCIVSIWDNEKKMWVSKDDTGTESNTEAAKGLASDSFKRSCFNWGIGRELYSAPFIWISKDKCNIEQKNNKWVCYDKFRVGAINITNKRIVGLSIVRGQDVVFTYGTIKTYREKLRDYCKTHEIDGKMIAQTCGLNRESTEEDYRDALDYAQRLGG